MNDDSTHSAVPLAAAADPDSQHTPVRAWACGTCGTLFHADQRPLADACCPKPCVFQEGTAGACTEPAERGSSHCEPHRKAWRARWEAERVEKAHKVSMVDYKGPVSYRDAGDGSYGEGYFADVTELLEKCEEEGLPRPTYAWTCEKEVAGTSAERVIQEATENMHEDAGSTIGTAERNELQAFLDDWWARNKVESWMGSDTRRGHATVVVIPPIAEEFQLVTVSVVSDPPPGCEIRHDAADDRPTTVPVEPVSGTVPASDEPAPPAAEPTDPA